MFPPDDPDGPTYLGGIDSFLKAIGPLERMCRKCCPKCERKDCKLQAQKPIAELILVWQTLYGTGPATHKHCAGGWYCGKWAWRFNSALDVLN